VREHKAARSLVVVDRVTAALRPVLARAAEASPDGGEGKRADDQAASVTTLLLAVTAVRRSGERVQVNVESLPEVLVVVVSIVSRAASV